MHGEKLPEGAQGWTPYGQPYFGEGLAGKLKEYAWSFSKDVKATDDEGWADIKSRWNATMQRGVNPNAPLTEEQRAKAKEHAQIGLEAVGAWWKTMEANKESVLSPVLRTTRVAMQMVGDVFSKPAHLIEQTVSALHGLQEAADEVGGPIPNLEDNAFTKGLRATPLGVAYDLTRIALSPDSGNWEKTLKRIDSGWNAGRIFYAGVLDESIRQDFIRRYEAGENPDLLAMELSNRNIDIWGHEVNANLVEMGGQLLFDPLNAVGMITKGGQIAKAIDRAEDVGGLYRNMEAVEALKVLGSATDDAQSAKAWQTVVKAHSEAVTAVEQGKLLKQGFGLRDLTVASRENALIGKSGDFIGLSAGSMIREGFSKEDFLEAFKFGVKSVAADATEMQEGLAALSKLPNAQMWLGDDAITTFKTVRNLLEGEGGLVDFSKIDRLLSKTDDMADFAEQAVKLTQAAAKNQFATVSQMQEAAKLAKEAAKTGAPVGKKTQQLAEMYAKVPSYAKVTNAINESKIGQLRQWMSNTLGTFYFNYQGGVAVKNILSNNVLMGIDQGAHAFAGFDDVVDAAGVITKKAKIWSDGAVEKNLTAWFGEFKAAGSTGFESAVSSASGGKKSTIFGKLMEKGESLGAKRIFNTTVKDVMRKLLTPEKLGDVSLLKKAGMNDAEIAHFARLFYAEKGNVQDVLKSYRAYKSGKAGEESFEAWRNLDFITKRQMDVLDDLDIADDLHDLTKTAQTKEDIEAAFARWKNTVKEYAKGAVDDTPGLSEGNPGIEVFGRLSDAENSGMLEKGASSVYASIMEASDNAIKEFTSSLRSTVDSMQRMDKIPMEKRVELANMKNKIFDALEKSGGDTKKIANQIVDSAWAWTDEIKAAKDGDWALYWKRAGLEGQPPLDLDRKTLLNELWKQSKDRQSAVWNSHFEKAFADSEELVKALQEHMDVTALQSTFSSSRWAVEQAQTYRTAVFENGALRIKPMDNIMWMAKEYGIPSATGKGVPLDQSLLKIINEFSGETLKASAKTAEKGKNALSILKEQGGINADEFSDIFSGTRGVDKQGVTVGLMTNKGMGIDEAGRTLVEHGFLTADQAQDANVIRDFIRNYKNEAPLTDAGMEAAQLDYFAGQGVDVARAPVSKYGSLADVPPNEAHAALERWRIANGRPEVKLSGFAIPPAQVDGAMPSAARAWAGNSKGLNHVLDTIKNNILNDWGRKTASPLTPEIEKALQAFAREAAPRVDAAKAVAVKVATEARNFTLLNYGAKTYGDVAAAWVMPYHFWYSQQYKNWIGRLGRSPEVVAGYAKYKDAMEKINYDMPDFFKQNVDLSKGLNFLGIKTEHPLFLNLEATLNPLYGLTGTDFNDPDKRTDWFSNTLDDIGKFGPSVFAPIALANAVRLSLKGEADAAARWGNRLFPETKQLKELASVYLGKPIELDPAVWAFSNGIDPYERARVGRALAGLVGQPLEDGTIITKEMVLDASHSQSGELWDMAYQNATKLRAGPGGIYSLASWLGGAGLKARTEQDVQIDQMYSKMSQLWAMNNGGALTPEQYKQGWQELAREFPFMDVVLLAKRGGKERDAAFSYNVLSRIPPGSSFEILSATGLKEEDIQKFYDSKGFTDPNVTFTPSEKQRFMASILDIAATYALPPDATRQEWDAAKLQYGNMRTEITKAYGEEIWNTLSTYYDLQDEDRQKAADFKEAHPEIAAALEAKRWLTINNPTLYKYYGSLDTVESYFNGQKRAELIAKYGEGIIALQEEYYNLDETVGYNSKLLSRAQKAFKRAHPELQKYWDDKKKADEEMNRSFVSFASTLPDAEGGAILRSDFVPLNATMQELADVGAPAAQFSWQDFQQIASPPLQEIVRLYWEQGQELPRAARNELDYLAENSGFDNGDDLLRMAGLALQP